MNASRISYAKKVWLLGLMAVSAPAFSAEVDPKAESLLRAMAEVVKGAESLQVATVWTTDASASGLMNKSRTEGFVAREAPNRFAFRVTGDSPGAVILSDGAQMTTHLEKYRSYAQEPAPEHFALLEGGLVQKVMGQTPYHAFLLSADPYEALVGDASKIVYHGVEKHREIPCHRLEIFREGPGFNLYIQEEGQPLVRAIEPDTEAMEKQLSFRIPGIEVEIAFTYDWKIGEPIERSEFAFAPAEDLFRKPTLLAMLQAGPPHALLGKEAPSFSLQKLDGSEFTLSEELGEKIVILDFWSMRCGPCIQALPTLAEVAKEYESKGVVLLAVNLGEPADMVQTFLENQEVELPVGLDLARAAATSYQVGPIPQTVLIGKNGIVENVHIGLPHDLKGVLTKELDTLIEGKSLLK